MEQVEHADTRKRLCNDVGEPIRRGAGVQRRQECGDVEDLADSVDYDKDIRRLKIARIPAVFSKLLKNDIL